VEAIERRALFVAVIVAIVLAFDRPDFTSSLGRGWEVTLYILGLVALAAAASLLAFVVAPQGAVTLTRETRERLLFIAFALAMAAILQQGLLRAYATYWTHKHGQF
jgi:O-antigen/teichoic acid export membrane protein